MFEDKIIVGGDFDCPLNPQMDKKGGIMITRQSIVDHIKEIQTVLNLHNIWRVKNPNLKSFTWSQKSHFSFCRLESTLAYIRCPLRHGQRCRYMYTCSTFN